MIGAVGLPGISTALAILKVAIGFGLVIFVHELGHFLMARRNGVFVHKFAIGFDFFGARLFSWTRGGTEYVIGALPLGGYVKMKGQYDMPEGAAPSDADSDSYQSRTVWQRSQIISAGVIANFLSAFALCWLAMVVGYHSLPAEVGALSFDTLEAGLRPGDVIAEIDGERINSWEDVVISYATREPGSTMTVGVLRDGKPMAVDLRVHRDPRLPINYPDFTGPVELRVGGIEAGSAADEAGVRPGDFLRAIDGKTVRSWAEFQQLVRRRADRDVLLSVARQPGAPGGSGGEAATIDLLVHASSRTADETPRYLPGFEPEQPPVLDFVMPGSTGWEAGLRPGDRVLAVGGEGVQSWYGLWRRSWAFGEDEAIPLTVAREGSEPWTVLVPPGPIPDWGLGTGALPALGLAGRTPERLVVGTPGPGAHPQIEKGDVVVAISGKVRRGADGDKGTTDWKVEDPDWPTLLLLLSNLAEPRFSLDVERDGKRHSLQVVATEDPRPLTFGFLGVAPLAREILVRKGPIEALLPSLRAPFRILDDFVDGIRAMLLRRASARMFAGPVGIIQATYSFAEKSTGDLANFLALLSVNLAVVNFLPIPITDGGHFIFLLYERIWGRRMEERLEARFQWAGLVFILLVFLFATFNDVRRIFGF